MPPSQPESEFDQVIAHVASLCVTSLEHNIGQFPRRTGQKLLLGPPLGYYPMLAPPAFSIELVNKDTHYREEPIPILAYRIIFALEDLPPLTFFIPKIYVVPDYLRQDIIPSLAAELKALLSRRLPVNELLDHCAFAFRNQMRRLLQNLIENGFQCTLSPTLVAKFQVQLGRITVSRRDGNMWHLRISIHEGYSIEYDIPSSRPLSADLWRQILDQYP